MSVRLTNILGYLTLFATLAAIWVLFGEDPRLESGARGELTFEGLADAVNETSQISLKQGKEVVTLIQAEGKWQVQERSGYVADESKVVALLKGLARSERREPKTTNPDRFDRLGLTDEAILIGLKDKAGKSLLDFKMGKRKEGANGRSLTYTFREGETRAWLVTALAEAQPQPIWWLDKKLLEIDEKRVKTISYGHTVLNRAAEGDGFVVSNLKKDEVAVADWKLGQPVRTLADVELADVRHVANPLMTPSGTLSVQTQDGLTVDFTFFTEEDGTNWAQLEASFDASARDNGESKVLEGAPEDGAAEAAALNQKFKGWLFKLDGADTAVLTRSREEFIQPPVKEEKPAS